MKIVKNYKNFFLLITFLFLSGCGYKPIFSTENISFKIDEFNSNGSKSSKQLINNLKVYSKIEEFSRIYNLEIILNENRGIESKNSKGEAIILSQIISGNIKIKENGKKLINIPINSKFTYRNISSKFDLSEYEENIIENLVQKISNDLVVRLIDLSND